MAARVFFGGADEEESAKQVEGRWPIWQAILDFDPQVFIWLGDNIYADMKRPARIVGKERTYGPWKNAPRFFPASINDMEHMYAQAKNKPGYAELRSRAKIIGTWDDHDYGLDDSGKELTVKNASQKLLLDFLDEAISSKRRIQEGVYASYTFGPRDKQVKVILLDTRYHRDPMFSNGDMLGERQWTWLEQQLRGNEAQITIIGSSIQVLPNFSATVQPLFTVESWSHFPNERERLFTLLADTHATGVLFISGDVHFCEVTRYDCGVSYPLYEFTSSGISHAVENAVAPHFSFLIRLAAWLTPSTLRVQSSNCRYKSCAYGKENFGTIEINWDAKPVSVIGQVRDVNGSYVAKEKILLADLRPHAPTNSDLESNERHCQLESELPWFSKYFLAMVTVGILSGVSVFCLVCLYFMGGWLKKTLKAKLA
ncbi:hypothetical protein GOP47_0001956 [Adiantum capillus-veneris]|uniref:PhoD-like phosphatase metallophosphatase domain-containing protein n=1 Tax=Adiantum capillus-veneris TaxID=13818 RepID=A0A9D4V9P2_ADICA|nr:hypothetical protein GOP47_0001956 [Adiantum capillus-veneris]